MTLMQQRMRVCLFFFFQAEDGIRDLTVTGVQTCALPISVNGDVKRLFIHRKGATRAFGPGHPDVPEPFRAVGQPVLIGGAMRSEERRVGEEGRSRWGPDHLKKKKEKGVFVSDKQHNKSLY